MGSPNRRMMRTRGPVYRAIVQDFVFMHFRGSDATWLGWSASIVWDWRHVHDACNGYAGGGDSADCGFSTGSDATDSDFHFAHPQFLCFADGVLCGHCGGVGCAFLGAAIADFPAG